MEDYAKLLNKIINNKAMCKARFIRGKLGWIKQAITELSIHFNHTRRSANKVADWMAKKSIDGKRGLRTSKIKRSIKETRGREDKLGQLIFPLRFKFLCLNQPKNCSVNIRQVQGDVAIPRVRFMKGRGQVAPAQVSWKSLAMSIEGSPREES